MKDSLILKWKDERLEISKQSLEELDLPIHLAGAHPVIVLRYIQARLTQLEHIEQVLWEEFRLSHIGGFKSRFIVKYRYGILYPSRP
jgi:hypothetical protein